MNQDHSVVEITSLTPADKRNSKPAFPAIPTQTGEWNLISVAEFQIILLNDVCKRMSELNVLATSILLNV